MAYHVPLLVTLLLCGMSCYQATFFDDAIEWGVDNVKKVEKPIVNTVEKVAKPFARDIANIVPHSRAARAVYEQELEFEPGTDEIQTQQQQQRKKCRRGELRWKRKCHFFSNDRLNWFDAITTCKYVVGGKLLEIYQKRDLNLVAKVIKHRGKKGEYWIGGSNFLNHSEYRWMSTQRKINKNYWAPKEPNNVGGWERCLEVRSSGMTNDDACLEKQFFICERPLCADCGDMTMEDDQDELDLLRD